MRVVDRHVGLFQGAEKPYEGARVLAAINQLLDQARQAGAPIFAARHTGPAGSPLDGGVTRRVIVGLKTQYCIDSTCRLAADMGFQAVLVADAHTCMDTPVLAAAAIIAHHHATLAGPFVTLAHAVDVRF